MELHHRSLTAKDVKDWVDLGMTMANSPEITDETDLDVIRGMMDACEENDIKMILCDRRLYWSGIFMLAKRQFFVQIIKSRLTEKQVGNVLKYF